VRGSCDCGFRARADASLAKPSVASHGPPLGTQAMHVVMDRPRFAAPFLTEPKGGEREKPRAHSWGFCDRVGETLVFGFHSLARR
jgi:hypothetical protein